MKKLFSLLLCIALCLLCACGDAVPEETSAAATQAATTGALSTTEEPTTLFPAEVAPPRKSVQGAKLNLPAWANNGWMVVYHDGATYFRQYNAGCFEKSGLWGKPDEIPGAKKQMMRMDADGSVHTLFEDDGNGGIFIDSKGNFYLQRLLSNDDYTYQAYSLDPKGKLRWTTNENVGSIYALDEARGVLICDGYYAVDCATGKSTALNKTAAQMDLLCYDNTNGWLYYREFVSGQDEFDGKHLIKHVDYSGQNNQIVTTIETGQLTGDCRDEESGWVCKWSELSHAHKTGDSLFVFAADYQGTGHFYYSGALARIDNDGKWEEISPEKRKPADWYGIFKPTYYAKDGPVWQGEEKYDYVIYASYGADAVDVLLRDELKSLGEFEYGEDNNRFETEVIYAGRDVWFTVKDGDYDQEASIGWRDAYAIKHTYIYRKNGATGEIKLVYEY